MGPTIKIQLASGTDLSMLILKFTSGNEGSVTAKSQPQHWQISNMQDPPPSSLPHFIKSLQFFKVWTNEIFIFAKFLKF